MDSLHPNYPYMSYKPNTNHNYSQCHRKNNFGSSNHGFQRTHSSALSYFSAVTESGPICIAQWEVQKLGLELGPGAPGGYPPGVSSRRCRSFVSENISHADPQIHPIFSLPLHTISSKICSFPRLFGDPACRAR